MAVKAHTAIHRRDDRGEHREDDPAHVGRGDGDPLRVVLGVGPHPSGRLAARDRAVLGATDVVARCIEAGGVTGVGSGVVTAAVPGAGH